MQKQSRNHDSGGLGSEWNSVPPQQRVCIPQVAFGGRRTLRGASLMRLKVISMHQDVGGTSARVAPEHLHNLRFDKVLQPVVRSDSILAAIGV